jgi:hypothetical protein
MVSEQRVELRPEAASSAQIKAGGSLCEAHVIGYQLSYANGAAMARADAVRQNAVTVEEVTVAVGIRE